MVSRGLQALGIRVAQTIRLIRGEPRIVRQSGSLPLGSAPTTFVVICGPGFDQTVPTAGTTCRLGWAAGFEQLGIPYLLLSVKDVARRLPGLPEPICWLSGTDYAYLDASSLAALRRTRHIVWVDTWFKGEQDFRQKHNLPRPPAVDETARARIRSTSPAFLFTISPERSFDFYRGWLDGGDRLVSLPLACDTLSYQQHPPKRSEFDCVEIAFVGGYWPYKARQLDPYLRPYADRLTVYGYSRWPYGSYGGLLPVDLESSLYKQAGVSPCINEPHVELMGIDINERVFKVLGSGGVAITDAVPAYREWFSPDELPVPSSVEEFHELVQLLLSTPDLRAAFARRGAEAVHARHTYFHRAKRVLALLDVRWPRAA